MQDIVMRRAAATAALLLLAVPGIPAAAEGTAGPSLARVVRITLDAPALPEEMAVLLPILMEEALESDLAMEAALPLPPGRSQEPAAGWELRLSVTGKGPWRLAARASATGQARDLARPPRINGKRVSFSGREGLHAAVRDLAADLLDQWRAAGVVPAGPAGGAPATPTPAAIERYGAAVSALRSREPGAAKDSLNAALKEDPSPAAAALQKAYLELTHGSQPSACASPGSTPLAKHACEAIGSLREGRSAEALVASEAILSALPSSTWGHVLRGLSLSALGRLDEGLAGWRHAAAVDPGDPRHHFWLGLSQMGAGQFEQAAATLRRAREGWPGLWRAYALEAEARARQRDIEGATAVARDLASAMQSKGAIPSSDQESPDLMLGCLQLMQGKFEDAVATFKNALDRLTEAGAPITATRTLHEALVEMKRDMVRSRDPLTRDRQLKDAEATLDRYSAALSESERQERPWPLLRLRGLLQVRRGETAEAWKTVEQIRTHSGRQGYTDYEDAYLSAAIMLKEGDVEGAIAQFEKVAAVRGRMVDLMDLAQVQMRLGRYDAARPTFNAFDDRLSRYDPSGPKPGELAVATPHLALQIPIYHLARAQFSYFTGDAADSRKHYSRMLGYFRAPDDQFMPFVKEAELRGATPE